MIFHVCTLYLSGTLSCLFGDIIFQEIYPIDITIVFLKGASVFDNLCVVFFFKMCKWIVASFFRLLISLEGRSDRSLYLCFTLEMQMTYQMTSFSCGSYTDVLYATVTMSVCTYLRVCTYQSIPGKHLPSSAFLGCDESSIQQGQPVIHSFTSHTWPAIVHQTASPAAHTHRHKCNYTQMRTHLQANVHIIL